MPCPSPVIYTFDEAGCIVIGKISGLVDSVGNDWVIVDVSGVGYLVHASGRTLASLPALGEHVSLSIETYVREDAIKLYGFVSPDEKSWFLHLQSVQGVGARVALAILDVLQPGDLQQAVVLGDKSAFARASGVGPKLAARIASELKDKQPPTSPLMGGAFTPPSSETVSGAERREGLKDMILRNDAISALVNLGYNEVKANLAVTNAYAKFDEDPAVDILIKAALKEIS